jgi:hypothetical protein
MNGLTLSFRVRVLIWGPCIDLFILLSFKSRDSSVGIARGYGLDDRRSRVRVPAGAGNFSLHHRVQIGSGAHPASYPMGTRGSYPGGKAAGREADHSPPSSAEVKNAWSYTSTPQYAFMAWCLVKHRDSFYLFTFLCYLVIPKCLLNRPFSEENLNCNINLHYYCYYH